jgi:hypothetical protein
MLIPDANAQYNGGISSHNSSLTISPGDAIAVYIEPISESAQNYYVVDLSAGTMDSWVMEDKDTNEFPMVINYAIGDWIVEDPSGGIAGSGPLASLPMANYGATVMYASEAFSQSAGNPSYVNNFFPGTSPFLGIWYIPGSNQTAISTVSVLSPDVLMFFQPP